MASPKFKGTRWVDRVSGARRFTIPGRFRIVPKGTRGATQSFMSKPGGQRGLDEIWLKQRTETVRRMAWRMQTRRAR